MSEPTYTVLLYLTGLLGAALYAGLYQLYVRPKHRLLAFALFFIVIGARQVYITALGQAPLYTSILLVISSIIISIFVGSISPLRCALAVVFDLTADLVAVLLLYLLLTVWNIPMGMDNTLGASPEVNIIFRLVAHGLAALVSLAMYRFLWIKVVDAQKPGRLFYLAYLCAFQLTGTMVFYFALYSDLRISLSTMIITILGIILASDVAFWMLFRQQDRNTEIEQQNRLIASVMEAEEKRSILVQQNLDQVRSLRHDWRNQLQILSLLLDSGEVDTAREQLNSMAALTYVCTETYARNPTLNAVASMTAERCKCAGIQFACALSLPESLPLESISLSSLFFNLLDNAVEACKRSGLEETMVDIRGGIRGGEAIVTIRNSKADSSHPLKTGFRTEKASPQEHGLGTQIVSRILKDSGGSIVYTDLGNEMLTTVSLGPAEQEPAPLTPLDKPEDIATES